MITSYILVGLLVIVVGYFGYQEYQKKSLGNALDKQKDEKIPPVVQAHVNDGRAREIVQDARDEAFRIKKQAEEESRKIRSEIFQLQQNVSQKEESIDRKVGALEERERQLGIREKELEEKRQEQIVRLEKIAGLTRDEAKNLLVKTVEERLKEDVARRIKEAEDTTRREVDRLTAQILVEAMQKGATDYVAEYTTSSVKITDEETKGRIIGREGRNIRALEQATGVDFDLDLEGEIRVSSFDQVRREIAKISLEKLIADGRVQPSRIEEIVDKTRKEVENIMYKAGEQLAYESKVSNLPRELIALLGRFKYRTSYGQNQFLHTLETVKIAVALAQMVGVNVDLARRIALFHDIGKVVEGEGSHTDLGADVLRKYGTDEKIIAGVATQHDDNFSSLEAAITFIADAISGARPGARYAAYEEYAKRLGELENIAKGFTGVEKVFAIEAGREVRVLVVPEQISDADIVKLAHDIAEKIKKDVTYPGQVKVNVIRETRAQAVAT